MLVQVPQSERHGLVKITLNSPKGQLDVVTDGSHKSYDIALPAGVKEEDVSVTAQFCLNSGSPDPDMATMVLKEKIAKSKPEVKPQPKIEAEVKTIFAVADMATAAKVVTPKAEEVTTDGSAVEK